ncbi:MAG: ferritin family protein [Syntrophomonadaceae bacterium]|jgi:rubrerythrin|nr:ferritin family protein [Syntrophomonadaceae bacterium]MDH7497264.1 ferritin family protein [Syntrophomonadaceae bacterium]
MWEGELQILKTALINEVEGEQFYALAAERSGDAELRQAFGKLADDERKHQEFLRHLAQQISARESEVKVDVLEFIEVSSPAIFVRAPAMTTPGNWEISAFYVGILMEKASVDYYREAASRTTLASAKQLYERLAAWEQSHLDALEKVYEVLQQEWWERQGFSPS